ncbi:hypothetical protein D3C86_1805250 [compost metagenome]
MLTRRSAVACPAGPTLKNWPTAKSAAQKLRMQPCPARSMEGKSAATGSNAAAVARPVDTDASATEAALPRERNPRRFNAGVCAMKNGSFVGEIN